MTAALQAVLQGLKYIPASLGVKALSKVNPKFKNFFTEAASYGVDTNRAISYLTDRFSNPNNQQFEQGLAQRGAQGQLRPDEMAAQTDISNSRIPGRALKGIASFAGAGIGGSGSESDQQPDQQAQGQSQQAEQPVGVQGFIAQHPELGAFMDKQINEGKSPDQAALAAKKSRKFSPIVDSIEKSVGQDFVSLVNQLYNGEGRSGGLNKESIARTGQVQQDILAQQQGSTPDKIQGLIQALNAVREARQSRGR